MTFGGRDKFAHVGTTDVEAGDAPDRPVPRPPASTIDRHRRRLLGGPRRRRSSGTALEGPARPRRARHQGAHADGRRAERRRPLPPSPDRRLRGEPAPPRHRPHRPLPGPRVGRADAARGDAARARHARAVGQGPLRRLLQLRRLADDEGARGLRPARLPAVRLPAGLLLAAGARRGVRDRSPSAIDQGVGILVWSPLAGGLLSGKYRRGQAGPGGRAPPDGLERAARPRRGRSSTTSSTRSSRSPRPTASPPRRSRSRGCSAARA